MSQTSLFELPLIPICPPRDPHASILLLSPLTTLTLPSTIRFHLPSRTLRRPPIKVLLKTCIQTSGRVDHTVARLEPGLTGGFSLAV